MYVRKKKLNFCFFEICWILNTVYTSSLKNEYPLGRWCNLWTVYENFHDVSPNPNIRSLTMRLSCVRQSWQSNRLFLQFSELGPPTTSSECVPSPLVPGGGGTLVCGRGGRSQFGRGDRHSGTLGIYVLCDVSLGRCDFKWTTGLRFITFWTTEPCDYAAGQVVIVYEQCRGCITRHYCA